MDGLHYVIAVNQIERELGQTARDAGPHGDHDPVDELRHHARLRRLSRREHMPPVEAAGPAGVDTGLQPAGAASGR